MSVSRLTLILDVFYHSPPYLFFLGFIFMWMSVLPVFVPCMCLVPVVSKRVLDTENWVLGTGLRFSVRATVLHTLHPNF